jgi:hypothetical protein
MSIEETPEERSARKLLKKEGKEKVEKVEKVSKKRKIEDDEDGVPVKSKKALKGCCRRRTKETNKIYFEC